MSTQSNSQLSQRIRRYLACGLPLLGLVLVVLYLSLFGLYRNWGIGSAATPVTDVDNYYFKILTALLRNLEVARSVELYNAITAKHVIVWGYGTGLVGLALVAAIAVCAYVIFQAMRDWAGPQRWIATLSVLLVCLVLYPYVTRWCGAFNKFTVIPRQFWGLIRAQLSPQQGLLDIVNFEMFIVAVGYAVSTLLALASAATLWPVRQLDSPSTATIEDGAKYLSMQMKHLRLILYVGALLLVIISFRQRMTFNWALDYLQPLPLLKNQKDYEYAGLIYEHLKTLTANAVLATSILNTLLLAAFYVPAGLFLQRRAHELSRLAVEVGSEPKNPLEKDSVPDAANVAAKQEEWLKTRNLIFPFKEQVPKVIAILSPLLAGPLGELLNFFK